MCLADEETCDCACHSLNEDVEHIMPCCIKCLYCGSNIAEFYLELHTEKCKKINPRVQCLNCAEIVDSENYEKHLKECIKKFREIADKIKNKPTD